MERDLLLTMFTAGQCEGSVRDRPAGREDPDHGLHRRPRPRLHRRRELQGRGRVPPAEGLQAPLTEPVMMFDISLSNKIFLT